MAPTPGLAAKGSMGRCHAASQPQPTPCGSGHLEIVPASGPWRARLRRLLSGPAWRQWIVHPARTRSRRLRATERLPARCPIALMHCPQMCSRHGRLQTACAPGQTPEPATDRRSLVQCRPCSVTKNTSLPQTCCTTLSRHAALVLSREACRRRTVVGDAARRRRGEFALGDVGLVPSAESTQAPSRSSVCTEAFASSASIVSPASVTRRREAESLSRAWPEIVRQAWPERPRWEAPPPRPGTLPRPVR